MNVFHIHGLRDTQPRRLVIEALRTSGSSLSAREIHEAIRRRGSSINAVTVYRVLQTLAQKGLVHAHPCDGRFTLCTLPDKHGHHGFLHCTGCGKISEFHDERLCALEDAIARHSRFQPISHVSEIMGLCERCR